MEKFEIKQPIDLFIKFEIWSNKLKSLHEDHYFRLVSAYTVLKLCAQICEKEYHLALGTAFPTDEKLKVSIETIVLLGQYREKHRALIGNAYVLTERAENEPNLEKRSRYRKEAGTAFESDGQLQELVSSVEKLCFGSIAQFKLLKIALRSGPKHNQLLQNMKQQSRT